MSEEMKRTKMNTIQALELEWKCPYCHNVNQETMFADTNEEKKDHPRFEYLEVKENEIWVVILGVRRLKCPYCLKICTGERE